MDIKAYIESGILEDYVLGTASEQELREVRCLSSIYPELQQELDAIEKRLMQFSEPEAPKVELDMNSFMKRVESTKQLPAMEVAKMETTAKHTDSPDLASSAKGSNERDEHSVKVVQMPIGFRIWQVASIILLFVSAYFIWFGMQRVKSSEDLMATNRALKEEVDRMSGEMESSIQMANMMRNENVLKIGLKSVDPAQSQAAVVFWNKEDNTVYLDASKLPPPPSGKQYQLWTLADGTPIDQGVVPLDTSGIMTMKNANRADAFAITLEEEGGKPTPNLEQLKVMGEVVKG